MSNPFISELTPLSTMDLIHLNNTLSGGYWLGKVLSALNSRTPWDYEMIRSRVSPFAWSVISGKSR